MKEKLGKKSTRSGPANTPDSVVLSIGYSLPLLSKRNRLLRSAGFKVLTATSLARALRIANSHPLDVVVLGHRIPAGDRTRIAAKIKSIDLGVGIIMLYRDAIEHAELADAILNLNGDPYDLIQTIRYLRSKRFAHGQKGASDGASA